MSAPQQQPGAQQVQQSKVTIGPPDVKRADPKTLALANFLRHNKTLKQRSGILGAERHDFFRVKRAIRALQSPEYAKARAKTPSLLPEITSRESAVEVLKWLPMGKFAFRIVKLETKKAQEAGGKPEHGVPVCQVYPQQDFGDDMYYMWLYEPVSSMTYVYSVLALLAVISIVLYPLWPRVMRLGVYYASTGLLSLLVVFFAMALLRLIIFAISYPFLSQGFWLFPNLFEDVGVLDSFRPLYGWHGERYLPEVKKRDKSKPINRGLDGSVDLSDMIVVQAKRNQFNESLKQEMEQKTAKLMEWGNQEKERLLQDPSKAANANNIVGQMIQKELMTLQKGAQSRAAKFNKELEEEANKIAKQCAEDNERRKALIASKKKEKQLKKEKGTTNNVEKTEKHAVNDEKVEADASSSSPESSPKKNKKKSKSKAKKRTVTLEDANE